MLKYFINKFNFYFLKFKFFIYLFYFYILHLNLIYFLFTNISSQPNKIKLKKINILAIIIFFLAFFTNFFDFILIP